MLKNLSTYFFLRNQRTLDWNSSMVFNGYKSQSLDYLWIAPFCDTLHCDPGEPHIASRAKARKATTGKVDPSWLSTLGKSFDGRKTFIVPHPPMNGIPPTIPTATTAIWFCHWVHNNYWNFRNVNIDFYIMKSDNLQYNMLVCWSDGTNNSPSVWLSKHFFHNFL